MEAVVEEEVNGYDPLSQANKHIMLKNGLMEFDSIEHGTCCCGHQKSDHLWPTLDCCLIKELCICDRFLDKDSKTPVAERYSKLPTQKEEIEELVVKEGKIIHDRDSQEKFLKQYGVI